MSAALLARQSRNKPPSATSKASSKGKSKAHEITACTATASLLLYAQGSTILCVHHDTLALERRFTKHGHNVQWICVDNLSERGAGRFVVSYDVNQEAIVWDLFSGNEICRFAAFEPIAVAAWMRNGNIAFGNVKGEIILFSPSSSEHYSARTIYDPITALAPSWDCQTFAIGYKNGSILLASLQPAFTVVHTLSFARAPSPIATLAWHASSSKQKTDMLATQTADGDLRVWSISKPPANDQPRVIRVLKRGTDTQAGLQWMAWSKNGRIVQYSEKETWTWDVRTKRVTYEVIPTIEDVRGIANYGPTAVLFTMGPNYSVQQYDVENPQMVINMQHFPLNGRAEDSTSIPSISASESEDDLDPFNILGKDRIAATGAGIERSTSANSYTSQTDSMSSQTSSMIGLARGPSPIARTDRSGTTFSIGTMSHMSRSLLSGSSLAYPSSIHSPASNRSYRKASRLRNEVLRSPDENKPLTELFPFTRKRLFELPFKPLPPFDHTKQSKDSLRRQMLSIVFGWDDDIESLVRSEMANHRPGSAGNVLLAKWLDDEAEMIASMLSSGSSNPQLDWMMIAMANLGEKSKTIGQAVAQKMLTKGDVHTAVTFLMGVGEVDLAIEVYASGHYYMEAILLACLKKRTDWDKQSSLVRQWGEHVVNNSQQHLAIRCFAVAPPSTEGPPAVPPPQLLPYAQSSLPTQRYQASASSEISDLASRVPTPASQRIPTPGGQAVTSPDSQSSATPGGRLTPGKAALKLITDFGPPEREKRFRFPGLKSDDQTPTVQAGITPIADSAVEPTSAGPYGRDRVGTPGGFLRPRLPSIGEGSSPSPPGPNSAIDPLPLSSIERSDGKNEKRLSQQSLVLLTSARYDPNEGKRDTPLTALPAGSSSHLPMSPTQAHLDPTMNRRLTPSLGDTMSDGIPRIWSPDVERGDTPASFSTAQLEGTESILSGPSTVLSYKTAGTASISGSRYVGSTATDDSSYFSRHHRKIRSSKRSGHGSTGGSVEGGDLFDYRRPKHRHREPSEESRGRRHHHRVVKRSPSSPRPMSPEQLDIMVKTKSKDSKTSKAGKSVDKPRSRSDTRASRSRTPDQGKRSHRSTSRQKDTSKLSEVIGVSKLTEKGLGILEKEHAGVGSPASPLPMNPVADDYDRTVSPLDGPFKFIAADKQRIKSRERSRHSHRNTSARRDSSPDRRKHRSRSSSRQAQASQSRRPSLSDPATAPPINGQIKRNSDNNSLSAEDIRPGLPEHLSGTSVPPRDGTLSPRSDPRFVSEARRKELAAAELEARRLSLMRRPSAPSIPSPSVSHRKSFSYSDKANTVFSPNDSEASSPRRPGSKMGLPPTPRAMRHPSYNSTYGSAGAPDVPDVPEYLSTLADTVKRPGSAPIRAMSAPIEKQISNQIEKQPSQPLEANGFPAHPAFLDHIPKSRSSSRQNQKHLADDRRISPTGAPPHSDSDRGRAQSRARTPPILPELQHLASPTIPPPGPEAPAGLVERDPASEDNGIAVTVDEKPYRNSDPSTRVIEVPARDAAQSLGIEVVALDPAPPPTVVRAHRRERSGTSVSTSVTGLSNSSDNFVGKFKSMADRMRSTSRGRGPKSPPIEMSSSVSPYESVPRVPNGQPMSNMI